LIFNLTAFGEVKFEEVYPIKKSFFCKLIAPPEDGGRDS
jgi:hypothetical protein